MIILSTINIKYYSKNVTLDVLYIFAYNLNFVYVAENFGWLNFGKLWNDNRGEKLGKKREMTERVDEGGMVDGITESGRVRSLVRKPTGH